MRILPTNFPTVYILATLFSLSQVPAVHLSRVVVDHTHHSSSLTSTIALASPSTTSRSILTAAAGGGGGAGGGYLPDTAPYPTRCEYNKYLILYMH